MNQNQQQITQMSALAGVVGQVGCINILIIGLALGIGILTDRLLGTRAIFTVLLMVGSVPVALYLTVRISLTAAVRAQALMDVNKTEEKSEE